MEMGFHNINKTGPSKGIIEKRKPGRPKGSKNKLTLEQSQTLAELAREYTEDALSTVVEIMKDTSVLASSRLAAANIVLDRGYGKPTQPITGKDGGPIEFIDLTKLSENELNQLEHIIQIASNFGSDKEREAEERGGTTFIN